MYKRLLETLGRIGEVNGYVRMTLDKLGSIRGDLVCTDDDWQSWKFPHLIEALRKWTERNPPRHEEKDERKSKDPRTRSFQARAERCNQDHVFIAIVRNTSRWNATKLQLHRSVKKFYPQRSYASTVLVPATELQNVAAQPRVKYVVRNIIHPSVKASQNKC
jgi:hypothetical protein